MPSPAFYQQVEENRQARNVAPGQMANEVQEVPAFSGEPLPLESTLKPVEMLEDDCLPRVIVEWLRPASKVIGCPFGFLVLSAIVMAGNLIGSRVRLKPLRNSDWFVVPNIYAGLVGLPSTKKTPALDETRKPILELQAAARKKYEELKKDYDIAARFYEKKAGKLLGAAEDLENYKASLEELDKPVQPTQRRFETNDITTSKLIQFLGENPNGMTLFRDELTCWLSSLENDYDKNARPFILELWKGAIAYDLARVDGRDIHLSSGTLSIIGGVQPSKLQKYVAEAYSVDNSDGFLQRFLWDYSDITRVEKPTEENYLAMQRGYAAANKVYKKLADFDFAGKVIGANGDNFHVVKFSFEAQKIADEWKDETEAKAESLQVEDEAFSSFLYKLPKNCFAIALIFHCLEHIGSGHVPDEISTETLLRALSYMEVLVSHAERVFALGETRIVGVAQTLVGKIKKGALKQGFTARDITRKQWSGMTTAGIVNDVLSLLVDFGYLREIETAGARRHTIQYFFHPSLVVEGEK